MFCALGPGLEEDEEAPPASTRRAARAMHTKSETDGAYKSYNENNNNNNNNNNNIIIIINTRVSAAPAVYTSRPLKTARDSDILQRSCFALSGRLRFAKPGGRRGGRAPGGSGGGSRVGSFERARPIEADGGGGGELDLQMDPCQSLFLCLPCYGEFYFVAAERMV